jgi:formylglycine-generating enzyme required for sulfatase activity/Tol biopolymer transport system component/type II secretory pathway pseudopilin PulG
MDERKGFRFSRPDLLAALGISSLAILLIIPMIHSSRVSARQTQCANNLRQIGVALQAYFETNESFPYAARWTIEDLPVKRPELQPRTGHATHENWLQLLLPHLGEGELADSFDRTASITDPRNEAARTAELTILRCPDDPYNRHDNLYTYEDPGRGISSSFARGNYSINGGTQSVNRYPGYDAAPSADGYHYAFDQNRTEFQAWGNGVAGINKAFRRDDFMNGLSTLVAVNEVRAGIHPIDPRGVWALGQLGGSITFGHGVTGDDAGPNNQGDRADDVLGCGTLHRVLGSDAIARERMPCCSYWELNLQATSRSLHDRGVNTLMMDGSARFISDTIDPSLWHVMHSRETPSGVLDESDIASSGITREISANKNNSPASGQLLISEGNHFGGQILKKVVNSIGMELVFIPAGEFTMGTPDTGFENTVPAECPPHRVRITKPYYLGVCEVTQEQYERVMGKNPSWLTASSGLAYKPEQETGLLPVEQVSWEDATEFCRRMSQIFAEKEVGFDYRLPTEAEWEYACRSGRSEPFPWSAYGNPRTGDNAGEEFKKPLHTTMVGSYPPNPFGLHDMRGNVYEWCADWFARDYYRRSPMDDPQGPESGYLRVVRGGDWLFVGEGCMINRRIASPRHFSPFIGFRVAASARTDAKRMHPAPSAVQALFPLAVYSSHRDPQSMELIKLDSVRRSASLLRSGPAVSPTWSRDGRQIAFVEAETNICVMDADGVNVQNLTNNAFRHAKAPAWSPDGSRIAFVATLDDAVWSLFVINADGGNTQTIVKSVGRQASPAWSSDGHRIVFVINREGQAGMFDLVTTDTAGTKVRIIRENVPSVASPSWSPDGGRVVFAHWGQTKDQLKLVIAKTDGSTIGQVTGGEAFDAFPAWSPDGGSIAYVHYDSKDDKRGDLMVHDVAKGTGRMISRGTLIHGEESRPTWGGLAGAATDRVTSEGPKTVGHSGDRRSEKR